MSTKHAVPMGRFVFIALLFALASRPQAQATLTASPDGLSLTEALAQAQPGDRIVVRPSLVEGERRVSVELVSGEDS